MSGKLNNFDVLKEMSAKNRDIRFAPLSNIVNLRKAKGGTEITIGIPGDLVAAIGIHGRFVGGPLLADKEQLRQTEEELKAAGVSDQEFPMTRTEWELLFAAVQWRRGNRTPPQLAEAVDAYIDGPKSPGNDAAGVTATATKPVRKRKRSCA